MIIADLYWLVLLAPKSKLSVLLIPININFELLEKQEKKTFSVILCEVGI